jgi:hypothetical protein
LRKPNVSKLGLSAKGKIVSREDAKSAKRRIIGWASLRAGIRVNLRHP